MLTFEKNDSLKKLFVALCRLMLFSLLVLNDPLLLKHHLSGGLSDLNRLIVPNVLVLLQLNIFQT